ncbi:MAG: hypothetical protein LC659_08960 [Myxococcales bacterium]|nr:hypothetical protein [Myxococcales bacterium]
MADRELPSIDEEFAELDAELERIAAMPLRTREQQNALLMALESLRDGWHEKGRARGDAPTWRRVVDEAIAVAFDGVLAEVRAGAGDAGGVVRLEPQMLQRHMRPVLDAVADGLRQNLVHKFGGKAQLPGAPPPEVDGADVAAILLTLFGPTKKKR